MKRLIALSLLLSTAILLIACSASTPGPNLSAPGSINTAQVLHVVDADTLDVLIAGNKHRVRLFGVDTPERGERCYQEAMDRTQELSGDSVLLEAGPRKEDKYGRLLFYLYTQSGESIDTKLIQEGLATAWTRDGQYRDKLVREENQARAKGKGCLW